MKNYIKTNEAPEAIGSYSQAVELDNLIFISGQLPIDPVSGTFAGDTIESQTNQSLKNIMAILNGVDLELKDIVKTTVYLSNMDSFASMNEVYGHYFTENCPARAAVEVSRLPKDALVEIEAIAVRR